MSTFSDYCIYIPRVSGFYSREEVERIISTHIANVSHIDCVNIPDANEISKRMVDYDYSAFVHISKFHNTAFAQNALARMETNGSCEFELDTDEVWFLVKYNVNQHYDGAATMALEDTLLQNYSQQRSISRLEHTVKNQSMEIHRMQNAIYQMLGHVFATESSKMFGIYNMMMHGKQVTSRWMHDENDDGTEEYEREFLVDSDVESEKETQEPKGKSSPSSLMDVSASVIPVPDRLKNTAELCGNN